MLDDNTIIDNSSEELSMTNTLRELIKNDKISHIKIATGFWDLKAIVLLYGELKAFLEKDGSHLDILIGKDPYVYQTMVSNPKYVDCKCTEDFISVQINELDLKPEYEDAVQLFMDYAIGDNPKIQIRLYDKSENGEKQFFHSKCYIFLGKGKSYGIVGSSNFTEKGLQGNSEVNYLEVHSAMVMAEPSDNSITIGHNHWFNRKWNEAESWNKTFLEQVLRKSKFAPKSDAPQNSDDHISTPEPLTPHEVYIKYLQEQFGDIASTDVQEQIKSYLPKTYKPLSYQIDAVQQCFYIMRQYHGFILADVVGLGKTLVGLLIVKKFVQEADKNNKVLIITPPAILPGWKKTLESIDKDAKNPIADNITFITTGKIQGIAGEVEDDVAGDALDSEIEANNYGLIMIDESHSFRNCETQKYKALDTLIDNICNQNGDYPYVGLLSATPQNNSPEDLRNQIYLFQRDRYNCDFTDIIGGRLDSYFAERQREFDVCRSIDYEDYVNDAEYHDEVNAHILSVFDEAVDFASEDDIRQYIKGKLKILSDDIQQKILAHIVVRRTRTDIKTYYKEDAEDLRFPTIDGPKVLNYNFSDKVASLFDETVNVILHPKKWKPGDDGHIGYYRYSAIMFLNDKTITNSFEHRNLSVERISNQLSKIMQILLVKRIESSFVAFKESLENLQRYTQNMIDMIENDCVFICPDIDVNKVFRDNNYRFDKVRAELLRKIAKKKGNNMMLPASKFKDEYIDYLYKDIEILDSLVRRWNKQSIDPKFEKFKNVAKSELFNGNINNPHGYDSKKLVIFTEAIATQEIIAEWMSEYSDEGFRVLSISSENRNDKLEAIRTNFDANCPEEEQRDDYNVIVTTEVLAEGVNLHRANVILNYDTPWNATRLMQRIGRVNRLGSKEDRVHVYNFKPSAESNKIIKLVQKAYAKLQAFHSMFGEDSQVYTQDEEIYNIDYNKEFDEEESPFGRYIQHLKEYQKQNPERYELIKSLEFKNIGGELQMNFGNYDAFVVRAENRKNANILLSHDDGTAEVVSVLRFLEVLYQPDYFDSMEYGEIDSDNFEEKREIVENVYNSFVDASVTNDVLKKKIKDSMKIADRLYDKVSDNEELSKLVKQARALLNKGNTMAVTAFQQYDLEQRTSGPSMFEEFDIESIVRTIFSKIAKRAEDKYGTPYFALFNY